tara:strand:- start:277 stop:1305 length:1029 start_codon:yes stop_codon:yes gene_type:complete
MTAKKESFGYSGLANLGNTCFLNSCMQALSHTYELTDLLSSDKYKQVLNNSLPESGLIEEWNNLRTLMWSQNGIIAPNRFVHNVQQLAVKKDRDLFTGWAQNDLPEFLLFLVECMHNSMARPVAVNITGKVKTKLDSRANECYKMLQQTYGRDYSEIVEMFYGIYVSELASMNGKTIHSINPEQYFMLDLEIPRKNATLYECFDSFTSYETLEGENAWFNEKTNKKENVKKRITFWSLPTILIITLKRFEIDGKRKRQDLVDFPLTDLNLSKYVCGYRAKRCIYDLYAVCNHSGGITGGHYTSYVKTRDDEWVHYNDTQVEHNISTHRIVSPKSYCLFYRKQ